jgi:hypothetical protein
VLEADAADPRSLDGEGLRGLVAASVGAVTEAIEGAGAGPLVLTDAEPLARYGQLDLLACLADHTTPRPRAVWLLVPVDQGQRAPMLDRQPVPIVSASQWLRLPAAWANAAGPAEEDEGR